MDIANLLHSMTVQGLTLKLGEAPDSIEVAGPVATLTLEQQRALAEHKQTLISMITPPPTCYFQESSEDFDIVFADSPEAMGPLYRCLEYFEKHIDAVGRHCPEKIDQTILEPKPQQAPCVRCGGVRTYLAIIHAGESLRRDCAKCGRFIDFPAWNNRGEAGAILTATVLEYNETSPLGAVNTLAGSDDPLSLTKENANG